MKSECELRVLRANLDAKRRSLKRYGGDKSILDFKIIILNEKIKLLDDILETEDNSCY
jgi:hypothetical protein